MNFVRALFSTVWITLVRVFNAITKDFFSNPFKSGTILFIAILPIYWHFPMERMPSVLRILMFPMLGWALCILLGCIVMILKEELGPVFERWIRDIRETFQKELKKNSEPATIETNSVFRKHMRIEVSRILKRKPEKIANKLDSVE